jgi:16S rRNA (adenine1518-N6/adenine1519-N6)-dimethyltransferase
VPPGPVVPPRPAADDRSPLNAAHRLRELEQRARRRFGQNFLVSADAVDRIVRAAHLRPADRVLEIGPGLGVLTERLVATGAAVRCLEIDRDLAAALRGQWPALDLVEADALHADFATICPGSGWKVVANLPYNVATPLLLRLLALPITFSAMVLMFQREVANRILAGPGDSARGSLSVQVQVRARVGHVLTLPPGAFHPAPKVHSVVLGFELLAAPDFGGVSPAAFDRAVRVGFRHRRKMLLNSLSSALPKERALAACASASVDPKARAETLDLDAWRRLARALVDVGLGAPIAGADAGAEDDVGSEDETIEDEGAEDAGSEDEPADPA